MDKKIIDGALLLKMFEHGTHVLNENKDSVDALNVFPVPDGDTGTNMSMTMNSAMVEAKNTVGNVADVSKAISKGSLMGARGNSGVILSQIFRGFAKACEDKETLDVVLLAKALQVASDTAYKAVMKPVEGTILTVIRKTAKKAKSFAKKHTDVAEFMQLVCREAEAVLKTTPSYLPVLKQAGVVDAGGQGLVCIFRGFYEVLSSDNLDKLFETQILISEPIDTATFVEHAQAHFNTDDIKFGYCTEFIVKGKNANSEEFREGIQELGDSMVFVQDDDLTKVHIHTNNPDKALKLGLEMGELVTIKIENMKRQHSEILSKDDDITEADMALANMSDDVQTKPYSLLAVSIGEGLNHLFEDLGADMIIKGGQTMNPSTEDILSAVDKVHGETVFVFPNNSNIILTANQAAEISDKNIVVIPSKTMPQGVSAMVAFDSDEDVETNTENMTDAISEVKTLQVTYSVRDTLFGNKEIKKNDILGVAEGDICCVGQNVHEVTLNSIEHMMDDELEVLSIYYGEDIKEEVAMALKTELKEKYKNLEIELYAGGQPLYYYICSLE